MSYRGWKLSGETRSKLLGQFVPKFADVYAHHITLSMGHGLPDPASAKIVGYVCGDDIEALVVELNGTTIRPDGKTYHITWSLDKASGMKPVMSNDLIKENGYTPLADGPIDIIVDPFWVDNNGREWFEYSRDDVTTAMKLCREAGYMEPEFVGTKGYPNWVEFTEKNRQKVSDFLKKMQEIIDQYDR